MRSRSLKPGLFRNEILGNADPLVTILFEGLWCLADREGRLEDRPLRICAQVFPYRRQVTEKRCDRMLQMLHDWVFIQRYEVAGRRYIQVVEFLKHQRPHSNEAPSIIPGLTSKDGAPRSPLTSTNGASAAHQGKPGFALTPDSGLLTPESIHSASGGVRAAGVRRGALADPSERDRAIAEILAEYPDNPHNPAHLTIAERQIGRLLDDEIVDAATLKANTIKFREQQDAMRRTGTQYVPKPATFYAYPRGQWVGPFPLPQDPDAPQIDDAGVAAFLRGGKS